MLVFSACMSVILCCCCDRMIWNVLKITKVDMNREMSVNMVRNIAKGFRWSLNLFCCFMVVVVLVNSFNESLCRVVLIWVISFFWLILGWVVVRI